jgi:hypothetical protein
MHMNAVFLLLYKAKFEQLEYEPHRYSFMNNNTIYRRQCMQYINVLGNHWILCHIHPSSEHLHCTIYDSMTPANKKLPTTIVNKLKRTFNIQDSLYYSYANVQQQLDGVYCGLFIIAFATDIAFSIPPMQSNYNILRMCHHLHNCICVSEMTPFPTHPSIPLCASIHSHSI